MSRYKKVTVIMGVIGTSFYGIGMCMSLVTEWNALNSGLILSAAGSAILILSTILYNKMSKRNTND